VSDRQRDEVICRQTSEADLNSNRFGCGLFEIVFDRDKIIEMYDAGQ
jgi:hypothetical protein